MPLSRFLLTPRADEPGPREVPSLRLVGDVPSARDTFLTPYQQPLSAAEAKSITSGAAARSRGVASYRALHGVRIDSISGFVLQVRII